MTKDELLSALANVKEELQQRFGIEKIALFGSYARDEATDDSDVDIGTFSSMKTLYIFDHDWSYLEIEIDKGLNSGISKKIHKEIISNIKNKYA